MHRFLSRRRFAGEDGFTIIEASIAMLVAALIFSALSAGLMSGLQATRDARLFQQATSMGEEAVEAARDLQYNDLSMRSTDPAFVSDPRIEAGPKFDPDGPGPLLAEPVVASSSGGSIVPHITTQTPLGGNTPFTTSRYVTWVDDAIQGGLAQSYKRMVVIIEWPMGNRTNSYRTSTFIALARRGLPVPKFELSQLPGPVEVEPGNVVVLPHTIRNLGIVDTYDLEMSVNPRNWVVNFYNDGNQNGTFEPVVDSLLLDTNSTGKPDTGSVQTGATTYFLAVFVLSPNEAQGPVTMTLKATSGANNAVSSTSNDTVVVGFAGITLNLHNNPTPPIGDTAAQANMAMDISPGSAETLFQYSTNYYSEDSAKPGRHIDKKNVQHDEGNTQFMANWVYQVPQNTKFNGTVQLKLWVAAKDFNCDKLLHIRAFLRRKDSQATNGGPELASGDAVIPPPGGTAPCGFQQITLTMALANVEVQKDKWLELKVTNRNTSGDAALIAYDTAAYNSTLKLPQVST